jgi:hypothetical protein
VTGTAPVPDPIVVDPCNVGTGGSEAEQYESMFLRVENVRVTNENPDGTDDFGEMEVDSCLRIDDAMDDSYDRTFDAAYTFIQGPLHYAFSNSKIRPRSGDDWQLE